MLVAALEERIADGTASEQLGDTDIQRLLAVATKLYVAATEQRGRFSPFPPGGPLVVTPTDVAATASEMLQALQIEIFELGMWQTRGGL